MVRSGRFFYITLFVSFSTVSLGSIPALATLGEAESSSGELAKALHGKHKKFSGNHSKKLRTEDTEDDSDSDESNNSTVSTNVDSSSSNSTSDSSLPYTINEIQTDGTTIREYTSSNGVIFALTWQGISHPDLSLILGGYFDEFDRKNRKTPRKRGHRSHRSIKTGRIVVERWGHMRNLMGLAYDPSLVPDGVNINDLLKK